MNTSPASLKSAIEIASGTADLNLLRERTAEELVTFGFIKTLESAKKYVSGLQVRPDGKLLVPEVEAAMQSSREFAEKKRAHDRSLNQAWSRQVDLENTINALAKARYKLDFEQQKLAALPGELARIRGMYSNFIGNADRGLHECYALFGESLNIDMFAAFLRKEIIPALQAEVAQLEAKLSEFGTAAASISIA